jgi:prolyl-tRNA editing enzyme YbaK/EbsC (Cys-tRNA(Pro) deacylase)
MTEEAAREPEALAHARQFLNEKRVRFLIHMHTEEVFTARDGVVHGFGRREQMAPSFVVRTSNGPVLAVVQGSRRLSYKKLKRLLGVKDISLASPEEVIAATGTPVGSVSLLQLNMPVIFDAGLLEEDVVFGGCGVANTTLEISPSDLAGVLDAAIADISDVRVE